MRQTASAGIADGVPVYRTFVTGDVNDLNDAVSAVSAQRCVHALANNGAFLVMQQRMVGFLPGITSSGTE